MRFIAPLLAVFMAATFAAACNTYNVLHLPSFARIATLTWTIPSLHTFLPRICHHAFGTSLTALLKDCPGDQICGRNCAFGPGEGSGTNICLEPCDTWCVQGNCNCDGRYFPEYLALEEWD